jgi:DNA-directed RNA polymerase specialized sigma24 family protein
MKKQRDLTQTEFDRLLGWLDADRDRAADKYEVIRRGLIELFDSRCCSDAEDLADRTINTVARKVEQIAPTYVGEPGLYFYGVAKRVLHECFRDKTVPLEFSLTSPETEETDDRENLFQCLDACLEQLSPEDHETILTYYFEAKRARIDLRQNLTGRLGLTSNALRVRAHRIRKSLEKCILRCLEQRETGRNKSN